MQYLYLASQSLTQDNTLQPWSHVRNPALSLRRRDPLHLRRVGDEPDRERPLGVQIHPALRNRGEPIFRQYYRHVHPSRHRRPSPRRDLAADRARRRQRRLEGRFYAAGHFYLPYTTMTGADPEDASSWLS